ncbi:unnamed protein product, partial [Mesorhabditis spiculigera]
MTEELNPVDRDFVIIKYPGIIKNIDRALETLGGLETIQQASTIYTFENMCDFQYLPLKGAQGNKDQVFEDLMPRLVPQSLTDSLSWWQRQDTVNATTPLYLPPFQFSRYNTPSMKILSRETDFSQEKTKRKSGHGQNLRVERRALSITVHANDPFPSEAPAEAVADADFRCKNEEPHRLLRELFKERPMWTRVACVFKTGLEDTMLKALLQKYAFYISSGPWGRLWCRFGYDPRLNTEARKYQSLVVSFRQHARIPERQRLKASTERSLYIGPHDTKEPIHFTYLPGRLPKVRQMWYSLCDIEMPEAQRMLVCEPIQPVCDDTHGWMSAELMDRLRKMIKDDVEKTTLEIDMGAEELPIIEDDWD